MNYVENIKKFLKTQGLIWTGHVYKNSKNKLNNVKDSDFEKLAEKTLIINFGEDGLCGMDAEIDLMTFRINGENINCPFTAYAGDDELNVELLRERNLSKEWVQFQLKNCGLVYAVALRKKCEEEKIRVQQEAETERKHLNKKIEYLGKRLIRANAEEERKIKKISEIEEMAKDV